MSYRDALLVMCGTFCIWPIVANLLARLVWNFLTRHDWRNIDWHNFNPWRKE